MIKFTQVKYKNILSTGDSWTTIPLDQSHTTLIIGNNGAGKSTMLDAISFALYGRAFRKINKAQLINSINKKGLCVELDFTIGSNNYRVIRGIKPNIFEVWKNDNMLNQEASARDYQSYLEQNILKLNFKSFGQIVVLGSSTFIPFMQMSAIHRREVIEDLLDIQIFTSMNIMLRESLSNLREKISTSKYNVSLIRTRIEAAKKHNESIRKLREDEVKALQKRVQQYHDSNSEAMHVITRENRRIDDLNASIADIDKITNRHNKLRDINIKLTSRIQGFEKEVNFFNDHRSCPTCKQDIDPVFREQTIKQRRNKLQELNDGHGQLIEAISDAAARLDEISNINKEISALNSNIIANRSTIQVNDNAIKELEQQVAQTKTQAETVSTEDIKTLGKEGRDVAKNLENMVQREDVLGIVATLLRDGGIKTKIIKQYIPIMNKLINKYLASMDFFVQFELDESFNETIRSRFRDNFSYASFSEGEKLRIDLALLFTWRAVSKMRNSVSTNLLIMDEIMDSSLDDSGTEDFLSIISDLAGDSNIFVISHKSDQLRDKFEQVLEFEKVRNFSRMIV